jgi:ribonuclease T1
MPQFAQAHGHHAPHRESAEIGVVSAAELPSEARETLRAIKQGGPYPYARDGVVFKNYERVLPDQPRGYYHEYTVAKSGARKRGARRIISGEVSEYYYTADHYQTFKRIRE